MKNKFKLPSDKKFGIFFSFIFIILYLYFLYIKNINILLFFLISIILLIISIFRPSILNKLNYLWYKLGIILGKIVSPIILSIIFLFLITPIAIFMKIIGRDYLNINDKNSNSYWKNYKNKINMKNQF